MTMGTVSVGDIGTPIVLTCSDGTAVESIAGATTIEVILLRPGGTPGTGVARTAELVTDGTDGQLRYTTVAGDIDVDGVWKASARVVLASGADREFQDPTATFVARRRLRT